MSDIDEVYGEFGERESHVVVGRIHISSWIREDLEKRLIELTSSGEEYQRLRKKRKIKFIWVFGDQEIQIIDNEKIVFARLGKIRSGYEKYYDKEKKSFRLRNVQSSQFLSYSNFVIHPKSHLILFEERKPLISIRQFTEIFSRIYKKHFRDLTDIGIDPIIETEMVFQILRQCKKIIDVQFKVTPSNPVDEPEFRKLDELLKDGNTKEARLRFRNEEAGLKVENTIIGEGIALSGAGYGEYTILVEREGNKEVIKSKDRISREVVKSIDQPEQLIKNFWEKMIKYIKKEGS